MASIEDLKEIADWPHKANCEFPNKKCDCTARLVPLLIAEIEAWRNWNDNIMAHNGDRPTQAETNAAGSRVVEARKALEGA